MLLKAAPLGGICAVGMITYRAWLNVVFEVLARIFLQFKVF